MKRIVNIGFLLIILAAGCRGQKVNSAEESEDKRQEIAIILLEKDLYGGTEEKSLEVIREEASLKAFYSKINRTRKPGLKVPQIDFKKDMLLLYCPGNTNSVLDENSVSLDIQEDTLEFAMSNTSKEENYNSVLLQPFYLFKLPLDEREVHLLEQE